MASEIANSSSRTQRTRRNLVKMGAVAAASTLATVHSASAGQGLICAVVDGINGILGTHLPCPDPKRGGVGSNCFLRGTKILTADGERKIEDLAIGDLLPAKFGGLRPIQWIGRYPIKKSDPSKSWVKDALPVRIARSALAPDVPHTELYVTGGHCLLIDGVLVPANMLINGTTIARCEAVGGELEFFHVKLESHDVIYAAGAPAETLFYVDECAVNFASYLRRYGMPITQEVRCAPLVEIWGGRAEMKSRLRSTLSPWIDFRNQADVVRDRLEEDGYVSSREPEIAV
jgi:hypothetical protein